MDGRMACPAGLGSPMAGEWTSGPQSGFVSAHMPLELPIDAGYWLDPRLRRRRVHILR